MRTIISILLVLFVITSCQNSTVDFNTDVAVPVSVQEVKTGSIQQIYQTTGVVNATNEWLATAEMAGDYELQTNSRTGKYFKMGDLVKKGDLVIKLNNREYENNANIDGAKLDLEISEMEYKKLQALYEKGGATARELVTGEKTLVSARQAYENAQINLNKMYIRAPFDGVITKLPFYSKGIEVAVSSELLGIMDYKEMVMDLSFTENMLPVVKVGQKVSLMNYALANDTLRGRISELSPVIEEETRTFAGRLVVENKANVLRPGMFVKCEIQLESKDSTIVISKDLLQSEGNRKIVYVTERDNARRRTVTTGLENSKEVEIVDGLKVGDRLIVKGYETLRDRTKIKVIK
ncbi:MAG: efflux RND transporter periplasmic adaptor subunit [Marinilabiliaceae bacterium]|nr:efflux RND transporter periplasmic adaptor subunit [Marinilabiliaceae bacterium]